MFLVSKKSQPRGERHRHTSTSLKKRDAKFLGDGMAERMVKHTGWGVTSKV